MFSSRVPASLAINRLTRRVQELRAAGTDILDLTVSNPTRVGLDYPASLLQLLADPAGLTYDPGPLGLPSARAAVAAEYARRGLSLPPDRIALTASTSEAYAVLFKLLCDPGDAVLVPRPSYPLFEHLTRLEGVQAVPYSIELHGRWAIDVDSVRRGLSPRTRGLLLVQPNNPTGSYADPSELEALRTICREHGLALVADEVFCDYPLEAVRSVHAPLDEDPLTFSLGGLSKSVGLPQLKLGWIAVGGSPRHAGDALARLELICDSYLSVSTPAQLAAPALLREGERVRTQIRARLASNLRALREIATEHPGCRVPPVEGGWSAVVQVPAVMPEEQLVLELLERDHVLVHPGYFFDFPREAFLVCSLIPPPDVFVHGTRLMMRRMEDLALG